MAIVAILLRLKQQSSGFHMNELRHLLLADIEALT
jgi:hypothetical protein